MELQYGFCAKFAEVGPDGYFAVFGGGLDKVAATQVPAVVQSMALLIHLTLDRKDIQSEHKIRVDLFSPKNERLPLDMEFPLPQVTETSLPDLPISISCALTLGNVIYPEFGEYNFRISTDGRQLGSIRLFVIAQETQQGGVQ